MAESHQGLKVDGAGPVATITIDRPQAHNALNAAILSELHDAVQALGRTGVRAIILTGAGERAFSAGADLHELTDLDSTAASDFLAVGQRTMAALEASSVPVIAAVNGVALGGGFELVLASTFSVMADHSSVGLPESGLGLIPGYGGTQRLAAVIGRPAAAHVMLTGQRLSAQRCYELGLTPVPPVPVAELMSLARELAEQVAAKGPRAQAAILTALGAAAPRPEALALEAALAGIVTGSAESREGIAAFREKRTPDFTTYQER